MRINRLSLVLPVLCAFLVIPAKADICDDINDLANAWTEIANFLNEHEEEGFSESDAREIDKLVNLVLQPTQDLGEALTKLGDEEEVQLGHELLQYVHELRGRQHGDMVAYLVDVMDDLTDTLDAVVDYCDQQ